MNTQLNKKYSHKIQKEDPEFLIKIPRNLLQDLQTIAKENGHTLNTQIIIRLIRTLETKDIEELENNMFDLLFK
jgi:hypothetical protein